MLVICLPSFIICFCLPETETLPKTQSVLLLHVFVESRVLVGQLTVPEEVVCHSPLLRELHPELLNYGGMSHAAPGDRGIITVSVYIDTSDTCSQVGLFIVPPKSRHK